MKALPLIRSEEYLDKIIKNRFSGSFMSNYKWVKLIEILVDNAHLIKKCQVKLIWEEKHLRELLIDEHTSYQFDYYESSMESMISGPPYGWYAYKEIQWIAFPRKIYSTKNAIQQDIIKIYEVIRQTGELCVEIDNNELIIYAYK